MRRSAALHNLGRHLLDILYFKFTSGGKALLAGVVLTAITGLMTLSNPIFYLFVALACLAMVASTAGVIFWPRCRLEGQLPAKAVAGRPLTARFTIQNRGPLPAYDISVGFFPLPRSLKEGTPGTNIPHLAGKESATVQVELLPLRRGIYQFEGPRHFTSFPFNLFRTGPLTGGRCSLTVLPSFNPVSLADLPVRSRYQPGGILLTSNVGESPEYIGNREYRAGDSIRRLDYRSWARLGSPVVREYQEEYYCRVALVLDTYIHRGRRRGLRGFADFEAAVSLSAALADALSDGEYIIDVFAAGPELYVFRSGRHVAPLDSVLEILAGIRESRKNPFRVLAPALSDELGSISTVVWVLLDWDKERRDAVRLAAESGCATKVIVIRDRQTSLPVSADEEWVGPISLLTSAQARKGALSL